MYRFTVVGDGRFSRKRAPDRPPPWARGRRARVCDHPELGVDAPSAPAYIRERSRALPVCDYLRQARQSTLGESGVAKPAECDLQGILQQCTIFVYHTGREYCGIHVQLGDVFAGILKRLRFVACDLAILLGVLS